MDDRLNREGFDRLNSAEKETLMRELAERFRMSFLGLQSFSCWGNGITTGVFEKDGMEFSFVPGDTVTIGWDRFAVGIDEDNQAEMNETFEEYEYEGTVEDFLRQSLAPVHQAVIPPMLVGRELQEIGWEPVALDDPRLTCHEDWMDEFQKCKAEGISTLVLNDCVRFTQVDGVWQAAIYHEMDYPQLKEMLKGRGYSLPTADAARCSLGGTGSTTPCTYAILWIGRWTTAPTTWRNPTFSDCPSPMTLTCGRWWKRIVSPSVAVTAGAIFAAEWGR